jgi:hypothetical protein
MFLSSSLLAQNEGSAVGWAAYLQIRVLTRQVEPSGSPVLFGVFPPPFLPQKQDKKLYTPTPHLGTFDQCCNQK